MALDLTGVSNFVQENVEPILKACVGGAGVTYEKVNKIATIKTDMKVPVIDSDASFQDGAGCTRTSVGSLKISQRSIGVKPIKVYEEICLDDLRPYFTQQMQPAGLKQESLPASLEEAWLERKAAKIAKQSETGYWRGDTTLVGAAGTANGNLNRFDGYLKRMRDLGFGTAGDPIKGNPTDILIATGITSTNVMGIFDGIFGLIPSEVLELKNIILWTPYDVVRTLNFKLRDLNYFHHTSMPGILDEFVYPGTNATIRPCAGLNGDTKKPIVATYDENLWIAEDLASEDTKADVWYSKDKDKLCLEFKWQIGTQIAFPEEVVFFELA